MSFWNDVGLCTYLPEHRVGDAIQVHRAFIGQVVENVESTHCFWSSLFVAKDKIDPLVQLARNKLTFQGLKWVRQEVRDSPNLADSL